MVRVEIAEGDAKLEELVERVEAGEDVVITRNGTPVARLVLHTVTNSMAAIYGIWRGRVHIAEDVDELPDDIAEAFGAR